jgi:hypothetical protein
VVSIAECGNGISDAHAVEVDIIAHIYQGQHSGRDAHAGRRDQLNLRRDVKEIENAQQDGRARRQRNPVGDANRDKWQTKHENPEVTIATFNRPGRGCKEQTARVWIR